MEEEKLRHLSAYAAKSTEALAENVRRGDKDDARMTDWQNPQNFSREPRDSASALQDRPRTCLLKIRNRPVTRRH
jgi:hypothetical protein